MFGRTGAANPNYIDGSSPERQRAYVQAIGRAFLRVGETQSQRDAIGIELSEAYVAMGHNRITDDAPLFSSWPPAEDPADQRMATEAQQRDLFASC